MSHNSYSEWCTHLTIWTRDRRVKRVQQSNILLDFRPVFGSRALSDSLADQVAELMPRAGLFLTEMASLLDDLPVALDRFGRLAARSEERRVGKECRCGGWWGS